MILTLRGCQPLPNTEYMSDIRCLVNPLSVSEKNHLPRVSLAVIIGFP
jgi:hypothetical protein